MKWNWGTKLVIAIVIFMSFIFVLVYLSTQNVINLVEKDYYPKGLKYQDRLDEIENARLLSKSFRILQLENDIIVSFPPMDPDTGTIMFFRPSGNEYDQTYRLEPDTAMSMKFPKSAFIKGKYLVKVFWKEKGKGYYFEKPYYFN